MKPCDGRTSRSSPRRCADGTLPRQFAGSESGDRHRAERVLELGGVVVSVLDRLGREDVRPHLVPPLVGFGVLTTNLVEGLMCL